METKKKYLELFKNNLRFYRDHLKSIAYRNNLSKLAQLYGSDKWGSHFYTPHYASHFKRLKNKKINLLEIGVGGYENPKAGGSSLKMWKHYFTKGNIYGIDIYDKSFFEEKRIKIFQGSQIDESFLQDVVKKASQFDIIIDDGSHINEHVIKTFKILFPTLKKGGLYVIEDTQTSYWENYGGDSDNLQTANTLMNFFKGLTDGLNYMELIKPNYTPTYFDTNISSIHFYHNLIFIYKNDNTHPSNMVENNQMRK